MSALRRWGRQIVVNRQDQAKGRLANPVPNGHRSSEKSAARLPVLITRNGKFCDEGYG